MESDGGEEEEKDWERECGSGGSRVWAQTHFLWVFVVYLRENGELGFQICGFHRQRERCKLQTLSLLKLNGKSLLFYFVHWDLREKERDPA